MRAVTHQLGSARIRPLVAAVGASVTLASLAAVIGVLPNARSPMRSEARPAGTELKTALPEACALCGTVESIRTLEISDEASLVDPGNDRSTNLRNASETDASSNAAMKVFDALGDAFSTGINENAKKRQVYRVTVRMNDGSFRAISLSTPPTFAAGERVRVVEGRLVRG